MTNHPSAILHVQYVVSKLQFNFHLDLTVVDFQTDNLSRKPNQEHKGRIW